VGDEKNAMEIPCDGPEQGKRQSFTECPGVGPKPA